MVEQAFADDTEQEIAVPKIPSPDRPPLRAVLPATQKVEQLVVVPVPLCYERFLAQVQQQGVLPDSWVRTAARSRHQGWSTGGNPVPFTPSATRLGTLMVSQLQFIDGIWVLAVRTVEVPQVQFLTEVEFDTLEQEERSGRWRGRRGSGGCLLAVVALTTVRIAVR